MDKYRILFSHKKKELLPFVTLWMNLEDIMQSDTDRETEILYDLTYRWNLKNVELIEMVGWQFPEPGRSEKEVDFGERVQTYKMNKFQGFNVQHGGYS